MQKKNSTAKKAIKRTPKPEEPSLSTADRDKLAQAVETILTTKGTPVSLFNAVGQFIEEGVSDTISKLWKAPLIAHLIDRVNERESQCEEVSREI